MAFLDSAPADYTLEPTDHDPFAGASPPPVESPADYKLEPVAHNPFQPLDLLSGNYSALQHGLTAEPPPSIGDMLHRAAVATGAYRDPNRGLGQTLYDAASGAMMAAPMEAGVPEAAEAAASPKITAYHGSPYDFSAFDPAKIGTGEGAQTYGHGLYFAESEGVAKSYRDTLAPGFRRTLNGIPFDELPSDAHKTVAQQMAATGATPKQIAALAEERAFDATQALKDAPQINSPDQMAAARRFAQRHVDIANAAREIAQTPAELGSISRGHMYQVEIGSDPSHFLDWDKPLDPDNQFHAYEAMRKNGLISGDDFESQMRRELNQRMNNQQLDEGPALQKWYEELRQQAESDDDAVSESAYDRQAMIEKWWDEGIGSSASTSAPNGETFVRQLADRMGGPEKASKALQDAGIPGIRYLDQGSREQGEGTHNYVVFDPSTIAIMRKYGLIGAGAIGATAALGKKNRDEQ